MLNEPTLQIRKPDFREVMPFAQGCAPQAGGAECGPEPLGCVHIICALNLSVRREPGSTSRTGQGIL